MGNLILIFFDLSVMKTVCANQIHIRNIDNQFKIIFALPMTKSNKFDDMEQKRIALIKEGRCVFSKDFFLKEYMMTGDWIAPEEKIPLRLKWIFGRVTFTSSSQFLTTNQNIMVKLDDIKQQIKLSKLLVFILLCHRSISHGVLKYPKWPSVF